MDILKNKYLSAFERHDSLRGVVALFVFLPMPTPPPSWGSFHFFPLAFEKTGAGRGYRTEHVQNDAADRFLARQENGLWRASISGMRILPEYVDTWDGFVDAVKGGWKPCLFRLMSQRFEIRRAQPGGIGTGDGETVAFQLSKSRRYEYGPAAVSRETVRFPWHNYPPMRVPVGNGEGTLLYPTERLRIWVGGVEMPWLEGWDVNRETGVVTFEVAPANGAALEAQCKFFVAMHGQDFYGLEHSGGSYTLPGGAELYQVASEA